MRLRIRTIITFMLNLFRKKKPEDKSGNVTHVLSDREIKRIAYHEAGHILLLACFETIESNVAAKIKWVATDLDASIGGCVEVPEIRNMVKTENAAKWEMLMYLAGYSAEVFFLNESSNGANEDYYRWITTSKEYLSGFGRKSRYYPYPENKFEYNSNQAALDEIFNEQQDDIQVFFTRNKMIIDKIANQLFLNRNLNADEISALLSGVVMTNGIPCGLVTSIN